MNIDKETLKKAIEGLKELQIERETEALHIIRTWFEEYCGWENLKATNHGFGLIGFSLGAEQILIDPSLGFIIYTEKFEKEAKFLAEIAQLRTREKRA